MCWYRAREHRAKAGALHKMQRQCVEAVIQLRQQLLGMQFLHRDHILQTTVQRQKLLITFPQADLGCELFFSCSSSSARPHVLEKNKEVTCIFLLKGHESSTLVPALLTCNGPLCHTTQLTLGLMLLTLFLNTMVCITSVEALLKLKLSGK